MIDDARGGLCMDEEGAVRSPALTAAADAAAVEVAAALVISVVAVPSPADLPVCHECTGREACGVASKMSGCAKEPCVARGGGGDWRPKGDPRCVHTFAFGWFVVS